MSAARSTNPGDARRGLKRAVRRHLRKALSGLTVDDINGITNRIYKRAVRPAMAAAFAEGVQVGADDVSRCCGCGSVDVIINPYDGSKI